VACGAALRLELLAGLFERDRLLGGQVVAVGVREVCGDVGERGPGAGLAERAPVEGRAAIGSATTRVPQMRQGSPVRR
jgi:hypothetical protein